MISPETEIVFNHIHAIDLDRLFDRQPSLRVNTLQSPTALKPFNFLFWL